MSCSWGALCLIRGRYVLLGGVMSYRGRYVL